MARINWGWKWYRLIYRKRYSLWSIVTPQAKGMAEGMLKEKHAIAKTMKTEGLPIDVIIKYTNLSADEIELL